MKLKVSLFFFLLVSISFYAQNIQVLNSVSQEPIWGVAIYNIDKTKSVITNFRGEANLDVFGPTELIYFKHLSHVLKKLSKQDIGAQHQVFLEPNTQGLEQIVISASKFEQDKKDVPQKIVGINAKQVLFSNPQTSADLLEGTGRFLYKKANWEAVAQ